MNPTRHYFTLAALCLALPASAEDKPATGALLINRSATSVLTLSGDKPETEGTLLLANDKPVPALPIDPEMMLLQIDLKVALQHYEKVKTELSGLPLQAELARFGDGPGRSPIADERKALRKKQEDPATTKEELQAAEQRVREALEADGEKWRSRRSLLAEEADRFRRQIQELAKEINQRAKDSAASKLQPAAPQPKPAP